MKRRQFWNVVPQPVRIAACAIVCIAVLIGLAAGFREGFDASQLPIWSQPFVGACIGLLGGGVVAIWILCLGYVYADARQRAMPPVLWTLVAALIPNLLGFLLYFALRRPLVSLCVQCRQPGDVGRFCSSCGFDKFASPSGSDRSQPAFTSPGSNLV